VQQQEELLPPQLASAWEQDQGYSKSKGIRQTAQNGTKNHSMSYLTSPLALLFRTAVLGFLGQLVPISAPGISPPPRDPIALPFTSFARVAPPSESSHDKLSNSAKSG